MCWNWFCKLNLQDVMGRTEHACFPLDISVCVQKLARTVN